MLTVMTGWSPAGWHEYAHRFVESFCRFWPAQVRCLAYVEEVRTDVPARIEQRLIWDIPGCRDFIEKHRDSASANGRDVQTWWKDGARKRGYNFRFDAWKFCRQGFIPLQAASECISGRDPALLCWLDADVVTTAPVPSGFVDRLLPPDRAVAYLGRGAKHSEIGFQLYRLPQALPHLQLFSDLYRSEEVFRLKEWHSAFVFDTARVRTGIAGHDLTPNGEGAVFEQSPLAQYMTHLKGDRKKASGYLRMRRR